MSVYVDPATYQFGRMKMCHMIADSHSELMSMATVIDVQYRWLQMADTYREHFDICQSKRTIAVSNGAMPISRKDLATKLLGRRVLGRDSNYFVLGVRSS